MIGCVDKTRTQKCVCRYLICLIMHIPTEKHFLISNYVKLTKKSRETGLVIQGNLQTNSKFTKF